MKDLKQLAAIKQGLVLKKDIQMQKLSQMNALLQKRRGLLQQLSQYQQQYIEMGKPGQHSLVPCLSKNLAAFMANLHHIITREEDEIAKIEESKGVVLNDIARLDQKTDFIHDLIEKFKADRAKLQDKRLQTSLDDLTLIKKFRDTYE